MNLNFKRRIIIIIFLIFFFLLVLANAQAQSVPTVVSISNFSSTHGETVIAPIQINNVENYGVGTVRVTYNPAVVHVTDVSNVPDSFVIAWNADSTTGIANISAWNMQGVSGDITFANVTFFAVGNAGNSTPLKLSVTILRNTNNEEIPESAIFINIGYFHIKNDANYPTPTPTPLQTSTPTSSPSPSPASDTGGGSSASFGTNSKPSPSPTSTNIPPAPAPTSPASFTPSPTPSPAIPLSPSETAEAKANVTPASTSGRVTPQGKIVPGFEIIFVCTALLIAYLLLFRKGGRK